MYEVILDDCDGRRSTLHVWEDGSVVRQSGYKNWRKLLWTFHDPEAPDWVYKALKIEK